MPGGAAGHHDDVPHLCHPLLVQSGSAQVNPPVFDQGAQGVGHRFGLLMDFLHHKVLEAAPLRRLRGECHLHRLPLDLVAVQVVEHGLSRRQPCKLQIADIVDGSGVLQDRRHIGGHIGLPLRKPDDHGAVLPGHPDFPRVVPEHQLQGVGAADAHHGLGDGVHGADFVLFIIVIHQLDHDLRIRVAVELVSVPQELFPKLLVVLDDAVVDAHHLGLHLAGGGSGAVPAHMGMGIGLGGLPVGGPSGMADAAGARERISAVGLFIEVAEPPRGLDHLGQLLPVPHGDARRVIASVLQLGQAVQKDRRCLMAAGKSYYSTHKSESSPSIFRYILYR